MNLKYRVIQLEKENAELKRQLEERLMCLCIPLEKIRFKDFMEELKKKKIEAGSPDEIKENLRLLELVIPAIEIE